MHRVFAFLFWSVVAIVGIPVVGIIVYVALSSFMSSPKQLSAITQLDVSKLTPSGLLPSGELARVFSFPTEYTDLQREEKEHELKGIIVQWKLPIYDISPGSSSFYRVQTLSGNGLVGTFCYVKPQNEIERHFLIKLKTGDYITCKGVISGVSMRHIEIRPAIAILP